MPCGSDLLAHGRSYNDGPQVSIIRSVSTLLEPTLPCGSHLLAEGCSYLVQSVHYRSHRCPLVIICWLMDARTNIDPRFQSLVQSVQYRSHRCPLVIICWLMDARTNIDPRFQSFVQSVHYRSRLCALVIICWLRDARISFSQYIIGADVALW